jgi:DNA adenine methylase
MKTQPQTFLRWAGSKRKLLPLLSGFWKSEYLRYVEPFMGSACLFFALRPQSAILADINGDLVRAFREVRDHPQAVANRLGRIPLGKHSYYRHRRKRLADLDSTDAAAHFIFLNRFCFNGLYRTNKKGLFNVPYGSAGTGRLPGGRDLRAASNVLRRCSIKVADFEDTLGMTRAGDFVYLDPPYAVGNRRVFRQYGPSSFGLDDLRRLSGALTKLDQRGVKFVLSYAYCREALEYFKGWPQQKVLIDRNIAGFARHRRRAAELLISNVEETNQAGLQ